jgi:hypothetical protein
MTKRICLTLLGAFSLGFVLTFAFPPPKEANAQVFGPTTRTTQLTVTPGPTTVENLTINGTCTGCPTGLAETSGSFTATFADGCTVDYVVNFEYRKIGTTVILKWGNGAPNVCVGDSLSFDTNALAPVPAEIRPSVTVTRSLAMVVTDNSTAQLGYMDISTSGNIQMIRCISQGSAATGNFPCSANSWTNANNRGFHAGTMVYSTAF